MNKTVVREAAAKIGGVIKLSEKLGLSRAAASQWDRVPAEHVLTVERLTGVSRHVLRPDIFGDAPDQSSDKAA